MGKNEANRGKDRSSGRDRASGRRRGAAVRGRGLPRKSDEGSRKSAQSEGDPTGQPIELARTYHTNLGRPSPRTAEVGLSFGIPLFSEDHTVAAGAVVTPAPGRIILFLGPSGSGKSSALASVEGQFAATCRVDRVAFTPDAAVVDQIAPWATLNEAIEIMTACGFSQPHLWVRRFAELSDGERFRARLARAIALQVHLGGGAPLLCDEFCTALHRRAAKAIGFNLRRLVTRLGLSVVLASCHDDVVSDLRPDVVVRLHGNGPCRVETTEFDGKRRPISFHRRLRIEKGRKRDYQAFAAMHYRATDELGFVDKVFVMRDGREGELLGIIVYAHSPLELALRNKATEARFSRNPQRVNRSFRIIRRLVMHPDVRGCGLGHRLVAVTLPQIGTEYVECLATMGAFNPVFEKAGMQRIGQYALCPKRAAALAALRTLDVDPNGRAFPMLVARRPRVRAIVARVVHEWYTSTTGGGDARVARQSPQFLAQTFRGLIGAKPVYYLWHRKSAQKRTRAA